MTDLAEDIYEATGIILGSATMEAMKQFVAARVAAARREGIEMALNACLRREHFHTVDDYDDENDDLRADGVRGCIAALRALLEDGR